MIVIPLYHFYLKVYFDYVQVHAVVPTDTNDCSKVGGNTDQYLLNYETPCEILHYRKWRTANRRTQFGQWSSYGWRPPNDLN